jgi:preprotein translocase subunit YajC
VAVLIIILLFAALIWFMFVLPARRRRTAHEAMQDSVGPGDEVITAGGLHGVVRELADDRLQLEIAPDVVVTLDRRAIAAVAREIEVEVDHEEDEAEAEQDDPGQDDEPAKREA